MERWVDPQSWNLALALALVTVPVLLGVAGALRGRRVRLRRLPAVDAIADVIGRAAELGRPVVYVCGTRDLDDVQTVASLTILGRVGELTARHGCRLMVPTNRSLVMEAARQVLREAYAAAGRPDTYHDGMVTYISDDQFAFAAHVDGLVARERPAASLLLGPFFAESLLLAEAGQRAGAVQVAGTAMAHQLPFLVAACDHVLIGEEFFAASAYLSGDPVGLGSLHGQDLVKYAVMILLGASAALGLLAGVTDWRAPAVVLEQVLRLTGTGG
ncbi:MAG: DUF6754 domain-containing protein [Candidatus Krumholzibacteriia bacterium]